MNVEASIFMSSGSPSAAAENYGRDLRRRAGQLHPLRPSRAICPPRGICARRHVRHRRARAPDGVVGVWNLLEKQLKNGDNAGFATTGVSLLAPVLLSWSNRSGSGRLPAAGGLVRPIGASRPNISS